MRSPQHRPSLDGVAEVQDATHAGYGEQWPGLPRRSWDRLQRRGRFAKPRMRDITP